MLALWAGLLAGALHVLAGPDHLVALAPLAIRHPARALRTGVAWGMGHGFGVLLLGALGLFVREAVDIDALSAWSELLVGFVLIGVGAWAVRSALRLVLKDAPADAHLHDVEPPRAHAPAAFGVGLLHGAAGAGHLFGVIPSLAFPPAEAITYLLAYLVAAVAAMAGFGLLAGLLARAGAGRRLRPILVSCGALSIALGGWWIVSGVEGVL